MRKWTVFLFLFAALISIPACLGEDTSDTDGDTEAETDGDSAETDEEASIDGDDATDGDAAVDGDTSVDGDSAGDDPFSGWDCESGTSLCTTMYCQAKKTYDHLYDRYAEETCDKSINTTEQCAAYIACAEEYKVCCAKYRSACVGDSVPSQLAIECGSNLGHCEDDAGKM